MSPPDPMHYGAHVARLCEVFDTALARHGFDAALIYAGEPRTAFLDDRNYPFIVNPLFNWWVPLPHHAFGFVHYRAGRQPVLVYHRPEDYWHKPPPAPAGAWVEQFDVRVVADRNAAHAALDGNGDRRVYLGEFEHAHGELNFAASNPQALLAQLHEARTVKSDWEIDCMRAANRIAARGHGAAKRAFRNGDSEYDIHLAYLAATGQSEHELPYSNIIALNENGATLHYTDRERQAPDGLRTFLIDAGGACNGYAADITRTYAIAGDDLFDDLLTRMEKLQLALCAGATAGTDYVTLNDTAHRGIAGILAETGLVRLPEETIYARGITTTFLPHGLGHFIGLQVHDVAGHQVDAGGGRREPPAAHPFLRLTRTLAPRNVTTIEPGLYFIDLKLAELRASDNAGHVDWTTIDRLRPFGGIRIEDDVVIADTGAPENLSREAFAAVAA